MVYYKVAEINSISVFTNHKAKIKDKKMSKSYYNESLKPNVL